MSNEILADAAGGYGIPSSFYDGLLGRILDNAKYAAVFGDTYAPGHDATVDTELGVRVAYGFAGRYQPRRDWCRECGCEQVVWMQSDLR